MPVTIFMLGVRMGCEGRIYEKLSTYKAVKLFYLYIVIKLVTKHAKFMPQNKNQIK